MWDGWFMIGDALPAAVGGLQAAGVPAHGALQVIKKLIQFSTYSHWFW